MEKSFNDTEIQTLKWLAASTTARMWRVGEGISEALKRALRLLIVEKSLGGEVHLVAAGRVSRGLYLRRIALMKACSLQ